MFSRTCFCGTRGDTTKRFRVVKGYFLLHSRLLSCSLRDLGTFCWFLPYLEYRGRASRLRKIDTKWALTLSAFASRRLRASS